MIILACVFTLILSISAEECNMTVHLTATFKVYYGWPFTYNCISVMNNPDFQYDDYNYDDDDYEGNEFSCNITDVNSGDVLLKSTFYPSYGDPDDNSIFIIPNITDDTTTVYDVQLQKGDSCWIQRTTLEPLYLVEESCEENLQRTEPVASENSLGSVFQTLCEVPGDSYDIPGRLIRGSSDVAKAYWLYNCQEYLPHNTNFNDDDNSLTFNSISYETNPGIYTCVVEYNGMKRYRIHQRMCVEPKVSSTLSIKCSNQTVAIGDDAEVECIVDGGVGVDVNVVFSARFNRLNSSGHIDFTRENSSCVAYIKSNMTARDERISCDVIKPSKKKCFDRIPTEEELASQKTLLKMRYRIKKVQESDFGNYRATITRASDSESAGFSLIYSREEGLTNSNRLLILCLAVIVGTAVICFLFWVVCAMEIRWTWFKYCKPAEKVSKNYIAYLAYYYNKDMTVTPPTQLENFVWSLNKTLGRNGGEIFDRCRDPAADQYTAGSISAKLSECHRVVIILTPEYVNDQWSVYEAYEAWKSVIENEIKIIFILFPKTMSAINDLPENSRTALKKALKRHQVINWDGTLPLPRRFRIQLELLMPKLRSQTKVEMHPTNGMPNGVAGVTQNGNGYGNQAKDTNQNVYANAV